MFYVRKNRKKRKEAKNCHSRLRSGIQEKIILDPRQTHSGMTKILSFRHEPDRNPGKKYLSFKSFRKQGITLPSIPPLKGGKKNRFK
jgi:hypothetical protein